MASKFQHISSVSLQSSFMSVPAGWVSIQGEAGDSGGLENTVCSWECQRRHRWLPGGGIYDPVKQNKGEITLAEDQIKSRESRVLTTDDSVLESWTWHTAQTFKQRHAVQDHILLELEPSAAFLNTISSSSYTSATSCRSLSFPPWKFHKPPSCCEITYCSAWRVGCLFMTKVFMWCANIHVYE